MAKPKFERTKPHLNIGTVGPYAAVAVVGAILGAVLASPGVTAAPEPIDAVPLYSCPAGAVVGEVHRADRVYATGQDGSGEWVEIRSPLDLDARVWARATALVPDGSFADLPEVECHDDLTLSVRAAPTPLPEVTPEPTAEPPVAVTPGPVVPVTPPPATPAPAQPQVGNVSASPNAIWEQHGACDAPTQSTVSAQIQDATSAELRWSVAGQSGSASMQPGAGGSWSGVLGPFASGTVGDQPSAPIVVTVVATNAAGRASGQTTVTLNRCPPIPQ